MHEMLLHPKQAEVHAFPARFKVVTAGRRWGKTALARFTLIQQAIGGPRRKVWYVAPSYRMAKQIMWDELVESIPRQWIKKVHHTEMWVMLKNKSKIELKGADDPDSLRGVGLYYVVLDEFQDMKPDVWTKVLRPTLAKDRGNAMIIGTPKGYANLYDVHKLGQDPNNRVWQSWQFPTITSPFIPESEIEMAKRDMDLKSFRQEFEASFETMSGRVYHEFDRNIHVKPCAFDPSKEIWVGVDFNIDPMSAVILQPSADGKTLHAVSEIFLRSSNVVELCEELERRYWRWSQNIIIFPDPAGGARQHARGESSLDIFRDKGFKKILYHKQHPPVQDRVNSMNRMFRDATGDVRFFVDPSCKNFIASLEQTLYKQGSGDIDKQMNIEHITDACGYPVQYRFPTKQIKIMGRNL
jgi:hypothetical protein